MTNLEGYLAIDEALRVENAALRKALADVLNSEVLKNAPMASYSEAIDRARTLIAQQDLQSKEGE